jgi:hypothetical protein
MTYHVMTQNNASLFRYFLILFILYIYSIIYACNCIYTIVVCLTLGGFYFVGMALRVYCLVGIAQFLRLRRLLAVLGSAALAWSNVEEDNLDVENVFKVALFIS